MADVIKSFETALRQAESSIKMIDHTKKTLSNNEQNVKDSETGAPGANPLSDSKKHLAAAQDLLAAHTVASQQKLNSAMMSYDLAKRNMPEPLKERYQKLLDVARSHGLSVV